MYKNKLVGLIFLFILCNGYKNNENMYIMQYSVSDDSAVKAKPQSAELVIVTPCSRVKNLDIIKEHIQFDKIKNWYIIYDNRHFEFNKRYEGVNKIIELSCKDEGQVGHQIRKMSLDLLKNSGVLIYFLDDDNIIHPNFWNLVPKFQCNHIYSFDQIRESEGRILKGGNLVVNYIDTAQYVFDVNLVNNERFCVSEYNADGLFIQQLGKNHKDKCVYFEELAAYYNKLNLP
jgi:hypothetical protein